MKIFSIPLLLVATALVSAQSEDGGLAKHPRAEIKASNAPVTQDEARATFARAEIVLRKSLGMPASASAVSIAPGAKPVKRSEVVAEMTRIYNVLRPKIKVTPTPVSFNSGVFRMADAKQKANLATLVRMGAVAKLGTLATGPADTISVPLFGDAVGFFMARMAYMTHMPSAKWTASIKKD